MSFLTALSSEPSVSARPLGRAGSVIKYILGLGMCDKRQKANSTRKKSGVHFGYIKDGLRLLFMERRWVGGAGWKDVETHHRE